MASEWATASLAELCEFRAGSVFTPALQGRSSGEFPFVKVSDMNLPANAVRIQDANNWVSGDDLRELRAKPFPPGTVVFAKIGEALRQNRLRQVARETVVDNNMMGAVPRVDRIDARYFYYALSKFDFSDIAQGTALPYLTVASLSALTMAVPPANEQRAIAHILGTLDDKIELNRRMNETLEAMARALFKSWFVDFGPVRAKAEARDPGLPKPLADLFPDSFEDSELGKIPKGWEVWRVGDIGSVICGKTPSTQVVEYYGGDVPFITIPDMHGRIFATATQKGLSLAGAASQQKKLLPAGAICVSCIATPGLVVITSEEAQTNQQINTVVPTRTEETYLWYWSLRNLGDEIRAGGSGGSVLRNLSTGRFAELRVLSPSAELRFSYHSLVVPLFNRILEDEKESRTLAALRDTLLPKLISGELRVRNAERFIAGTPTASSGVVA